MAATLGALTFAEYATGSRTRRTEIVATRRIPPEDYVGAQYYAPLLEAIPVALASMDPAAVLTVAAQGLELSGQERAYAEASAGLLRWWRRASGVVVPAGESVMETGGLRIDVTPHLAYRTRTGTEVALFHLKEAELTRDTAIAAARLLQVCMLDLLPGATPVVVDARRAKTHRIPTQTNLVKLDAWLASQATAYMKHQATTP
ncbi:hypothetical protein GCM10023148_44290 [Actinokineospora soli]